MIITSINHGLQLAQGFGEPRTVGAHMSDLYGSFYAQLEPKRYGKQQDDELPLERFEAGMAFEEMLEIGLKRRVAMAGAQLESVDRPGEFETQHTDECEVPVEDRTAGMGCWCGGGVFYTPDLLIFNDVTRLGEIKLTSMSAKDIPWVLGESFEDFDPKFDKYICQIKCYCKHLPTLYARLYAFSVREMVYFNDPKIFRAWDLEFTQQELDEEWEMMVRHGRQEGILT